VQALADKKAAEGASDTAAPAEAEAATES